VFLYTFGKFEEVLIDLVDIDYIFCPEEGLTTSFIVNFLQRNVIEDGNNPKSQRASSANLDPYPIPFHGPRCQQNYKFLAPVHFSKNTILEVVSFCNVENIDKDFGAAIISNPPRKLVGNPPIGPAVRNKYAQYQLGDLRASSASSSSIRRSITDRPPCQKLGSRASSPNGASSSEWCLVPPAASMSR